MSITAYTKTCASHTPGNRTLYLLGANKVKAITIATGEVMTMEVDAVGNMVKIEFDRDGLARMDEQTATKNGLLYVTQKLEIDLSKSSAALQKLIQEIADQSPCGIVAVVIDANGSRWLMGCETASATTATAVGMYMESANFNSGKAMDEDDADKYVVTLTGMFRHGALHINAAQEIDLTTVDVIKTPAG